MSRRFGTSPIWPKILGFPIFQTPTSTPRKCRHRAEVKKFEYRKTIYVRFESAASSATGIGSACPTVIRREAALSCRTAWTPRWGCSCPPTTIYCNCSVGVRFCYCLSSRGSVFLWKTNRHGLVLYPFYTLKNNSLPSGAVVCAIKCVIYRMSTA